MAIISEEDWVDFTADLRDLYKCPDCSQSIPHDPDYKFCPFCGVPIIFEMDWKDK
jgi:rRNA maturation endonuclease Nob1